MKRGGEIGRRTPLKRRRRPRVAQGDRDAAALFGALPRDARCAVTGMTKLDAARAGTRLQSHHVVSQEHLRKRSLGHLLWDLRNRLVVVEYPVHSNHTTAFRRIPRAALSEENEAFAAEAGLTYLLDRQYADE